jgi:hypothetical protein
VVEQLELRTLERADAVLDVRAVRADDVQLRVQVLHVAMQLDAAVFRTELGIVGRQQALSGADRHVTAQACVARTAQVPLVARDLDALVGGIGLEQVIDARIASQAGLAGRVVR